jgi:plasmid stabilization system protein ParE
VKKCRIIIQREAEADLREAFEFIRADSPKNAAVWLRGLYEAIESLETMPERCAFAREREELNTDVRQFVYHSHRILFTVEKRTVFVHHVRHTKMDTLKKLRGVAGRHRTKKRS